jgi:hypothetical protein
MESIKKIMLKFHENQFRSSRAAACGQTYMTTPTGAFLQLLISKARDCRATQGTYCPTANSNPVF